MTPPTEATVEPVTVDRHDRSGRRIGAARLDPRIFSVPVNVPLLHQVVTAQLAARRGGTQSTRTRSEVRGGSSKPFRQKGTGSARQGSIRAPHYTGGGIALGPKPRSYAQKTPKKMVQQALRCALSDRAQAGGIRLVDRFAFEVPKTKEANASLAALGCSGRVLVVLERADDHARRSFANLPEVTVLPVDQLSAYEVMVADVVVFTDETLPGERDFTTEHVQDASASAPSARPVAGPSEGADAEGAGAAAEADPAEVLAAGDEPAEAVTGSDGDEEATQP